MGNTNPKEKKDHRKKITISVKNPSSQKKIKRAMEKIQLIENDIKRSGLEINLEGLNEALTKIELLFPDKSWRKELESHIEKELNEDLIELEEKQQGLHKLILAASKAGEEARNEGRFDIAIDMLQDLDRTLLPAITDILPEKLLKELKFLLSKELQKTYFKKGKLAEAIKVIDSRDRMDCCTYEEYIESQIDKAHLLIQKGEFNQALIILKNALKEKTLSNNVKLTAEVKRTLGMVYRGQGAYEEALKWFKESQDLHKKANNEEGYYNALWGVGILHHLRGEWEPAIEIWKKLISIFETKDQEGKLTAKEHNYLFAKLYLDYSLSLELCGRYQKAEHMITKAMTILPSGEKSDFIRGKLHLYASELYWEQNKIEEASKEVKKVRNINLRRKARNLEPISELFILKAEIKVLLALDKADEAREKLQDQFDSLKSNWDKTQYYRLLSKIERHEMNFGLAKKSLNSSLEITREIGASPLSDELEYIELLIEMSKSGNQIALKEAELLLATLEKKVAENNLPALLLECKLLKGHLKRIHANFDKAYQIYAEIIKDADNLRLFRQKSKALEGINAIEDHGQRLSASTRELSVYRYLDDARRILEDYS
ncbi:MAG: tetratricopeptide repeat protein [Candidatus Hodarchaeota archaeon]